MKKRVGIILCIVFMLILSGCWARKEPKDLAVVDAVVFDITDEGMFRTIVEIINPSGGGGKQMNATDKGAFITAVGEGASLREAMNGISSSIEKSNFGGQNKVRFFSDKFAKQDFEPLFDLLLRDHLTDESPLVVVIKDEEEPGKIYTCNIGQADTVGNYIDSFSKYQPTSMAEAVFVTTMEFIRDDFKDGKQPVAGGSRDRRG